jgi:hypothetical protein
LGNAGPLRELALRQTHSLSGGQSDLARLHIWKSISVS